MRLIECGEWTATYGNSCQCHSIGGSLFCKEELPYSTSAGLVLQGKKTILVPVILCLERKVTGDNNEILGYSYRWDSTGFFTPVVKDQIQTGTSCYLFVK